MARALLERAAVAPGLPAETLYSLRLALGEFELRQGDHEAADRAYALAAEAQPEDPDVVLRRANLRLYQRGDLDGAVAIATQNPRLARIPEVKRLLAMSE